LRKKKKKDTSQKKPDALAGQFFFQSFSLFLKPVKLKAAMELDILRCGYSRQLVHSIFSTIGIPTLVTLVGSLSVSLDKGK